MAVAAIELEPAEFKGVAGRDEMGAEDERVFFEVYRARKREEARMLA